MHISYEVHTMCVHGERVYTRMYVMYTGVCVCVCAPKYQDI